MYFFRLTFALLLFSGSSYTQNKIQYLPVQFHNGLGPFGDGFFTVNWDTDKSGYTSFFKECLPVLKGVPRDLTDVSRAVIFFEARQFVYQNYKAGKIAKEKFVKWVKEANWTLDENRLVKDQIRCFVSVIRGKKKNGETVFMLDRNNNYDLSDDEPFTPVSWKSSSEELFENIIKIPYQRKSSNGIIVDSASIMIVLNGKELQFTMAEYATADILINENKHQLILCSDLFQSRSFSKTQFVVWADSMQSKKVNEDFILTDSIIFFLDKKPYRYNGFDIQKGLVSIEEVDLNNYYSPQMGFKAPLFSGTNVLNGKNISLQSLKGKYIFIDFWGTWCSPCRSELPKLKKAYSKIDREKVAMISIASSDKIDILKAFVKKEDMKWYQLLSNSITAHYHINAFPTNFVIDPEGKIILKDIDTEKLEELLNGLANHKISLKLEEPVKN